MKPLPERTCVGCGTRSSRSELDRWVLVEGVLTADPRRRLPGRGAYTCPGTACLQAAVARRRFDRVLRARVRIPDGFGRPATEE